MMDQGAGAAAFLWGLSACMSAMHRWPAIQVRSGGVVHEMKAPLGVADSLACEAWAIGCSPCQSHVTESW